MCRGRVAPRPHGALRGGGQGPLAVGDLLAGEAQQRARQDPVAPLDGVPEGAPLLGVQRLLGRSYASLVGAKWLSHEADAF